MMVHGSLVFFNLSTYSALSTFPFQGTQDLTDFLEENNERATHFVIGLNIRSRPQEFLRILDQGGDIAVHTYTHPYMTSLTNLEVVAEVAFIVSLSPSL